jgi:hypothetical protein
MGNYRCSEDIQTYSVDKYKENWKPHKALHFTTLIETSMPFDIPDGNIVKAYMKAQNARFEHGFNGETPEDENEKIRQMHNSGREATRRVTAEQRARFGLPPLSEEEFDKLYPKA